jgi:catalase
VADAYAHSKFIGFVAGARTLLDRAGVGDRLDDGFVSLDEVGAEEFVERCRAVRFWDRALLVSVP